MNSRDKILTAVKAAQPAKVGLPEIPQYGDGGPEVSPLEQFMSTLQAIGGHSRTVKGYDDIAETIRYQFPNVARVVTTCSELRTVAEVYCDSDVIATPENIDVAILKAHFAVAENGAVWLTEDIICDRSLPFICQHLIAIISASDIVPSMHEAYERIGGRDYGYSLFIAGPSKTADIEQSLVLGAHGPLSMTVFILP